MAEFTASTRERLAEKIKTLSISWGDFVLSSGARSKYYFDCRLTTLDPEGIHLVGEAMYELMSETARELGVSVEGIGGLTMGADPISIAVGATSWKKDPQHPWQVFVVRKEPKSHGQTKLIEGNFRIGMKVVVIDDVVTKGDSTIKAINAVKDAGGEVVFVGVLVDREQGGCDRIRELGYKVAALYKSSELLPANTQQNSAAAVSA